MTFDLKHIIESELAGKARDALAAVMQQNSITGQRNGCCKLAWLMMVWGNGRCKTAITRFS
jgi:hypothetical protein